MIGVDAKFDGFRQKFEWKMGARLDCVFCLLQGALSQFLYHRELIVNVQPND
jgi:hypothetical protein